VIYAIGGKYLKTAGELRSFRCDDFFRAALKYLDVMVKLNNIRSIVALLVTIYSLRALGGPGVW
jgi:hypothetical protein